MGINQLAPLFRASAHAPDGVIECYESVEAGWYCVGVQWHPEDDTASALDMQIFQDFMVACGSATPQIIQFPNRAAAELQLPNGPFSAHPGGSDGRRASWAC